jgi:tRNA dimethylallyltransferase
VEPVVFLTGPTCSGKSALALALAQRHEAEIVGADSRQIYRGMEIGTAAPSAADRARVPHHLVGFLDPYERYSAARFVDDALAAIDGIVARGKRALVVGGTGFYVRALAGDVALSDAHDETLRARLARELALHPPEFLHAWLAIRAPQRAAAVAPGDRYRIGRALEIALAGEARSASEVSVRERSDLRSRGFAFHKFVLDVPDDELIARIRTRTDAMLAAGLLDEAERIGERAVAADAVGYPQALAYLAGRATRAELRALLVRATRRYAKRQRTWFRSEPGVTYVADLPVAPLAMLDGIWPSARRSPGPAVGTLKP